MYNLMAYSVQGCRLVVQRGFSTICRVEVARHCWLHLPCLHVSTTYTVEELQQIH